MVLKRSVAVFSPLLLLPTKKPCEGRAQDVLSKWVVEKTPRCLFPASIYKAQGYCYDRELQVGAVHGLWYPGD